MKDPEAWAAEEFGSAMLGDERRTRRLVKMAAEVARRPAGTVMGACASSASREGAFRWLENPTIRSEPVAEAMQRAVLKRCQGQSVVHVAIDASSLTLSDEARARDIGAVGSWSQGARGVQVMTAFAIGADGGTPLGICSQQMWVREQRSKTKPKAHSANPEQRETRYWLELLRDTHEAFTQQLPDCEPFFQLDRGADCWPVLELAEQLGLLLTVRAAHNRRVDSPAGLLWQELETTSVRDRMRLHIPARRYVRKQRRVGKKRVDQWVERRARTSTFTIRAAEVPLLLNGNTRVVVNAVFIREARRSREDRLERLLVTTAPIKSKANIHAIIHGYTQRWRIEELHRAWKRGLCRVEDTQLRSRQAVFKWAIILAAVAARAIRLTYLAREKPDLPATEEFSRQELKALIAMREPAHAKLDDIPTLKQAVRWLADLGGYAGPHNGPPGPTVVGRGLRDLLIATKAIRNLKKL